MSLPEKLPNFPIGSVTTHGALSHPESGVSQHFGQKETLALPVIRGEESPSGEVERGLHLRGSLGFEIHPQAQNVYVTVEVVTRVQGPATDAEDTALYALLEHRIDWVVEKLAKKLRAVQARVQKTLDEERRKYEEAERRRETDSLP